MGELRMPSKKTLWTMMLSLSTLLIPTLTFGQSYAKVTVEAVFLRSQPANASERVGTIVKNDIFEITAITHDGWIGVKTPQGSTAYVYKSFVDVVDQIETEDIEIELEFDAESLQVDTLAQITGIGVRLRDYPDFTTSKVITTLDTSHTVILEYTVGDWCKVVAEGQEGYVNVQYVASEHLNTVPTKQLDEVERIYDTQSMTGSKPTQQSNNTTTGTSLSASELADAIEIGRAHV